MQEKPKVSPQARDLIRHFNAKPSAEASPKDFLASWTEYNLFILSPRSKITKTRKVLAQLPA